MYVSSKSKITCSRNYLKNYSQKLNYSNLSNLLSTSAIDILSDQISNRKKKPQIYVKGVAVVLNWHFFFLKYPYIQSTTCLTFSHVVKNCFRVSSRGRSKGHQYCLQANDSFSKQQWISCLRQAIVHSRDTTAQSNWAPLSLHSDAALSDIAELSLSSDTEMADDPVPWTITGARTMDGIQQMELLVKEDSVAVSPV